jgi:CRISPR-associated protein Cmr2
MKNSTWMTTAMAWCLAWGNEKTPQFDLAVLRQMQEALSKGIS